MAHTFAKGTGYDAYLNWARQHVLVVGDVMLDRYIRGAAYRLSPEAPVPIVTVHSVDVTPGGAANVAVNLANLGASTTLIGLCGKDEYATQLRQQLESSRVRVRLVEDGSSMTTCKTRVVAGSQHIVRIDSEEPVLLTGEQEQSIALLVEKELQTATAVVISDYNKGVITSGVCRAVIEASQRQKVPVIVDPKRVDIAQCAGATILCPNLIEAARLAGSDSTILNYQLVCRLADAIRSNCIRYAAITLGAAGSLLVESSGRATYFPTEARSVTDVAGAGDTVTAIVALTLAAGESIESSLVLANRAAGLVVQHSGTTAIRLGDLIQDIRNVGPALDSKVMRWEQAHANIVQQRTVGKRVVLIQVSCTTTPAEIDEQIRKCGNGCFYVVAVLTDDECMCSDATGTCRSITTLEQVACVDAVVPAGRTIKQECQMVDADFVLSATCATNATCGAAPMEANLSTTIAVA